MERKRVEQDEFIIWFRFRNERNIKFALSNVFEANGKKNQLLIG